MKLTPDEFRKKRNRERKNEERQRYRNKGLQSITVWINPKNKEKLMQYVEGLNKNETM